MRYILSCFCIQIEWCNIACHGEIFIMYNILYNFYTNNDNILVISFGVAMTFDVSHSIDLGSELLVVGDTDDSGENFSILYKTVYNVGS